MEWKDKTSTFKQIDVRGIQGNFFQGLKKQAMQLPAGSGLEIVQSFDPIPLYEVMEGLGFEHFTEQKDEAEFHAYFYRKEVKQEEKDIPMRPAALTNMPLIDEKLGNIAVNFWDLTWNDAHRHLPYEIRLLLSLTNAVGAGRMRQATRELVKAYIHGLDSAALDDVFELLAWNMGTVISAAETGLHAVRRLQDHQEHGKAGKGTQGDLRNAQGKVRGKESGCEGVRNDMQITRDTRLLDLINQYPWLKDELPKINEKFKMLNTPMGKIMMGKATIVEMSKKSGMDADTLIRKLHQLIGSHV